MVVLVAVLEPGLLAQRLGRVTALLGEDWQHPDRALELQLALRLRRLLSA